jgi:chromate transporter
VSHSGAEQSHNIPAAYGDFTTVSFKQAFLFWLKLGFVSFGGPTGQIAIMHSELVDKKGWISEARFLHALNYCMLLPGPEAQQLAIYIGWLLHKTIGGIVAGALFVIPSIFVLWGLSLIYVVYGKIPWITSMFYGLKGAVMAIVAVALLRIARKALRNEIMSLIAALAFVSIFFLKVPFPLIIFAAGLLGLAGGKLWPIKFAMPQASESTTSRSVINDHTVTAPHIRPSLRRSIRICVVGLLLWFTPILVVGLLLGRNHTIVREGIFFSKAAMITFGGAYAVLPYVSQQAVEKYHWLQAAQMMDGLGLAESTPGPLIMVVQFVGFLGGWNQAGTLSPLVAATLGALITTWSTFVPCFLWIFLGAPYMEQTRKNLHLSSGLSTITAAVVGVILNLVVWFAIHSLFPAKGHIDWVLLSLAIAAFVGMMRWKLNVVTVVLGCALFGFMVKKLFP